MKMSLKDISKNLNVSKATISLVLNGRGDEKRVSKETQERIIKFAKEHNYKANKVARALSRGKSDMIGLIVPNISDNFYGRIARRIERKAELFGYNVIFCSSGESMKKESELIQSMLDRQVDGLIIASSQKNEKDIQHLKRLKFPFVLIDRYYPNIETNFVGIDNKGGIAMAVNQLIKTGKKRIGFVSLTDVLEPLNERMESYLSTIKKNGLRFEKDFVQKVNYQNIDKEMSSVIQDLISQDTNIDGIVFATHFLAAEGLRALKRLKVKVPSEVAIVSFGQMNSFDLAEPAITSVLLPSSEIGDKAVDILLENMNEKMADYSVVFERTEIVIRKSCGEQD